VKTGKNPPQLFRNLLQWYARRADIEDLLGDIDEYFLYNLEDKSPIRAKLLYCRQVLSLIFSYALRKRKGDSYYSNFYSSNNLSMLQNYFKIAVRNFAKNKLFTSINIIGLALGMSICLLALSISVAIYQADEWHENKDRIVQINSSIRDSEENKLYASTFPALATHLESNYPFIEKTVRVKSGFAPVFEHKGNKIDLRGYFTDQSFLESFSFELIHGDASSALIEPYSIVLTQSAAAKLYRDENPVGKVLITKEGKFKVTGVLKDLKQTHLYFEVLTSMGTFDQLNTKLSTELDWINYRNNYLYLLLHPNTQKESLDKALEEAGLVANSFNPNKEIKLESIYLTGVVPRWNIGNALGIGWDQPGMLFFMSIGLLILLPAVFNYTNLSIARALKRAKEIGVRKVVGADKQQIKMQFIVETVLLSLLALIGSYILFIPLKEEFLTMVVAAAVLDTSIGLAQTLIFIGFAIVVGIIAGIFPAQFFARLNPVHTLKGDMKAGSVNISGIRKGLFIFQFFLSLVFIIGVGAILKQYKDVLNRNHGFESTNVLTVPFNGIDQQLVINELGNHPDVSRVSSASHLPGLPFSTLVSVIPNKVDTMDVGQVFIDDNFLINMEIDLIWDSGEGLANSNQNEELVYVNEQFLTSAAIFNSPSDSMLFTLVDGSNCRIAGVFKDINYEPVNRLIEPLIFRSSIEQTNYALLSIQSNDIKRTISELDLIWRGLDQNIRFEGAFLDDEIEKSYRFLAIQVKIFGFLSLMAITISCLGLLGMVSYTTENRTKEIAIRKIMGASVYQLHLLLTKEFVRMILIAAMIAIPFSYFFYDFVFLHLLVKYGTGVGALEIIVSILFLFLVGFLSIYWQTSKVTKANPAENLRYE
jgi:putative ABC transport system permease protein